MFMKHQGKPVITATKSSRRSVLTFNSVLGNKRKPVLYVKENSRILKFTQNTVVKKRKGKLVLTVRKRSSSWKFTQSTVESKRRRKPVPTVLKRSGTLKFTPCLNVNKS